MTIADHLFFIVIAFIYPVAGYISFRRLLRRLEAGEAVDRGKLYMHTAIGHWSLFLLGIALWLLQDRGWDALGFGLTTDSSFLVGAALTIAAIVLLVMQIKQVAAANPDEIRNFREQFGKLEIFLPHNGNELGRFYGLSLTAGIVEEMLWRGFLIWYISQFLPMWAAALISVIGFGLAHAYQGIKQLPKITIVGAAFAGLYVLTGSLLLPIILHAAVDIMQGRLAYDIIRRSDTDLSSTAGNGATIATSSPLKKDSCGT